MNTAISKFEYPLSAQLLLKLGGLAMLVVGFFLFNQSWESEVAQIIFIVFGVFFSGFGFFGMIEGFKKITISENSVVQKTPIKQIEILASDIIGYREIYYPNTKGANIQLVVFSKNGNQQITINKEGWGADYDSILNKIKSIYPKTDFEKAKKIIKKRKDLYKNIGKGFGILLIGFGVYQFFFLQVINPDDVPALYGIVEAPSLLSRLFLIILGVAIFLYYQFISPGHD